MKIKQIGANITLLCMKNGTEVLFSYDTPVAGFKPGTGHFKTSSHFSVTTSKHIGLYLKGQKVVEVEQSWIEGLLPE